MDRDRYLSAIRDDGEALAFVAEGNLAVPIPWCPGWTVADLVWHAGEVHEFWRTVVERRLTDPSAVDEVVRPGDTELIAWYRAGLGHLIAVLGAIDPATRVWTWAEQRQDVAFIVRRMAHETAVHRWDGEAAVGDATPIEADLASDGIDEFLEHFTAWRKDDAVPIGGSVHLHCTDVAGEWIVREADDGTITFERRHEKGDAAIRGPAADLLLALWRRVPLDRLDVVGDPDVARRLIDRHGLG